MAFQLLLLLPFTLNYKRCLCKLNTPRKSYAVFQGSMIKFSRESGTLLCIIYIKQCRCVITSLTLYCTKTSHCICAFNFPNLRAETASAVHSTRRQIYRACGLLIKCSQLLKWIKNSILQKISQDIRQILKFQISELYVLIS